MTQSAALAHLDRRALVAAAQEALPQMLADIERVISIETPSDDQEAVARGAADFAALIEERLGVAPESLVVDGTTHLRLRFGDGPARVVLVNHQDTVWPHGTLERLPFSTEDGILRGPGSFDMLTGAIMSVWATRLLLAAAGVPVPDTEDTTTAPGAGAAATGGASADAGASGPVPSPAEALAGLSILVTGDEEIGSVTSSDLIRAEAKEARAVFVMEASADGALKLSRKGTSMYTILVHGKAAHAGLEPEKGIHAGLELAHQMQVVAGLADPAEQTTVTPTKFSGGTTTNTVPALGQFDVDVRALTAEEQQRVDDAIRGLTPGIDGTRIEVRGGINRPPFEKEMSAALFDRAVALAAEIGIEEPRGVPVGGASDGNFTAGDGIPTLDGLGAVGDGAHAEHEHAIIEHIPPRTALLAALVADGLTD
ncbi:M20 family metallopeptidase [Brevibacterium sp. R8603A2]|uniref:M20 family metallopeptidase n=1 Tax=Brevibacterium sp. R8603A2 TaxID=2929779 RepID=UPI001FF9664D|nr:M20 family metallopeptidase [Brevibacterium sp. R8603A2]